jgi:hypothetical protein
LNKPDNSRRKSTRHKRPGDLRKMSKGKYESAFKQAHKEANLQLKTLYRVVEQTTREDKQDRNSKKKK